MQERNEILNEMEKAGLNGKAVDNFADKGVFQPNKETRKGVFFPEYWKKKKLNRAFVDELEKAAKSEPFATDEYGEYRFGTFLHGCAVVKVEITDNLLSVAIHSQHSVGLPMLREIRYKYAPDAMLMTMLMPARDQQISENTIVLYQIPGSLNEEGVQDVVFEGEEE